MIHFGPEHHESITALAETVELELSDETLSELGSFASLVSVWGRKTDLVSAKSVQALVEVLFLDAFMLSSIVPPNVRFVDVGAGAGAPAIPLLLLRPDLLGTLVEPRRKRVAFMRTAVGKLALHPRATVLEVHVDADDIDERVLADFAFSRATFEPAVWTELGLKLSPTVAVLAAKDVVTEVRTASECAYVVPSSGAKRIIHVLKR